MEVRLENLRESRKKGLCLRGDVFWGLIGLSGHGVGTKSSSPQPSSPVLGRPVSRVPRCWNGREGPWGQPGDSSGGGTCHPRPASWGWRRCRAKALFPPSDFALRHVDTCSGKVFKGAFPPLRGAVFMKLMHRDVEREAAFGF